MKWKIVQHKFGQDILEGDKIICSLALYDEEIDIPKRTILMSSAPELLEFLMEAKSLLNHLKIPPNLAEWYGNFEMNSSELIRIINND